MQGIELTQLGSAGAVVVVVLLFLKYQAAENERREKSYSKLTDAVNSMQAESAATREVIRETKDYMQHLNGELKEVARRKRQGGSDEAVSDRRR